MVKINNQKYIKMTIRKYPVSVLLSYTELKALEKQLSYILGKIREQEDFADWENETE